MLTTLVLISMGLALCFPSFRPGTIFYSQQVYPETRRIMGKITEKFVKIRKAILKEITNSKRSGQVLGVYCTALGNGMLLTAVEDIYEAGKDEMMVVFKWYDKNAHILSKTHVSLDEISAVCPVNKSLQESNLRLS
jgi:hypothetical protein